MTDLPPVLSNGVRFAALPSNGVRFVNTQFIREAQCFLMTIQNLQIVTDVIFADVGRPLKQAGRFCKKGIDAQVFMIHVKIFIATL